jgi:hypothetical protein
LKDPLPPFLPPLPPPRPATLLKIHEMNDISLHDYKNTPASMFVMSTQSLPRLRPSSYSSLLDTNVSSYSESKTHTALYQRSVRNSQKNLILETTYFLFDVLYLDTFFSCCCKSRITRDIFIPSYFSALECLDRIRQT